VVQVTIGWGGELKSSETDIIKSFVINAHNLISIFDKLMDWEGSIVGLNDSIWDLGRRHNWESAHNSVGIFFSDFGDKESSHTGSGTSSKWVSDLETL
jgi:hypothetical protein